MRNLLFQLLLASTTTAQIDTATISQAEKLIGISFTAGHRIPSAVAVLASRNKCIVYCVRHMVPVVIPASKDSRSLVKLVKAQSQR